MERGGGVTQQAASSHLGRRALTPRGGGVLKTLLAARPRCLPVGQPGPVSAPKPAPQKELPFYADVKRAFPEAPLRLVGRGRGEGPHQQLAGSQPPCFAPQPLDPIEMHDSTRSFFGRGESVFFFSRRRVGFLWWPDRTSLSNHPQPNLSPRRSLVAWLRSGSPPSPGHPQGPWMGAGTLRRQVPKQDLHYDVFCCNLKIAKSSAICTISGNSISSPKLLLLVFF